eukprot:454839-Hanusia_phi.AAC.6
MTEHLAGRGPRTVAAMQFKHILIFSCFLLLGLLRTQVQAAHGRFAIELRTDGSSGSWHCLGGQIEPGAEQASAQLSPPSPRRNAGVLQPVSARCTRIGCLLNVLADLSAADSQEGLTSSPGAFLLASKALRMQEEQLEEDLRKATTRSFTSFWVRRRRRKL